MSVTAVAGYNVFEVALNGATITHWGIGGMPTQRVMELYTQYYRNAHGCILIVKNSESCVQEAGDAFDRVVGAGTMRCKWQDMCNGSLPLLVLVVSHYFHDWQLKSDLNASSRYTAEEIDALLGIAGTGINYRIQMVDLKDFGSKLEGLCTGFNWLFDKMAASSYRTWKPTTAPRWLADINDRIS